MDAKITQEVKQVLQDTLTIIENQSRISPYWMLDQKITLDLSIGDINRLYYALELIKAL